MKMPELKNYKLFVSHAWKYDDDYNRLVNLLNNALNFKYSNHSVPKADPLHVNNAKELENDLRNQIRGTQIVLIIAGMYVNYSKWIQIEIDIANAMNKPMIGIQPFGSERTPIQVQTAVKEMVGWNTSSILDAIRRNSL